MEAGVTAAILASLWRRDIYRYAMCEAVRRLDGQ